MKHAKLFRLIGLTFLLNNMARHESQNKGQKRHKIFGGLIVGLLLISLSYAFVGHVMSLSEQSSPTNVTFDATNYNSSLGKYHVVRYVRVPNYAYVQNMTMTIEGDP